MRIEKDTCAICREVKFVDNDKVCKDCLDLAIGNLRDVLIPLRETTKKLNRLRDEQDNC